MRRSRILADRESDEEDDGRGPRAAREGRRAASAPAGIGRLCSWTTVNRAIDGTVHAYAVSINTDNLKDVAVSEIAKERSAAETGTRVLIAEIGSPHSRIFDPEMLRQRLVEEFGPYLLQYPRVHISVDGEGLDPNRS